MIPPVDPSAAQPADVPVTKLIVGEPDAPLIELTRIAALPTAHLRPVQLDPALHTLLGDLVRLLPGVGATGLQALATTYRLTFAPQVVAHLAAGTGTLMPALGGVRAIAVDGAGRIIGNGTLVAASGLTSPVTATLLWQTLAIATAQHYLHTMQAQLQAISQTLHAIEETLFLKDLALLVSHERYLQRIMRVIEQGAAQELDLPAISGQMEQMERECDQVQELMRMQMERLHAQVQTAPVSGWFHWDAINQVQAALPLVETFNRAAMAFAAAIQVKGMLALLRMHLFLQGRVGLLRLAEAAEDSHRGRVRMVALYDLILERCAQVSAAIDPFNITSALRTEITQGSTAMRQTLRTRFDRLDGDLAEAQQYGTALRTRSLPPPGLLLTCDENNRWRVVRDEPVRTHVHQW